MKSGKVRLTLRGAGTLVLGILLTGLGIWWRYPGLTGFGAALTGLAVAGFVSVLRSVPVEAQRDVHPRTVHRRSVCTGTLELASVSRRFPVHLDATDRIADEPVVVDVPPLGPGERTSVDYRIPTERRGVFPVGSLTLRRKGFLGMADSRTVLDDTIEVRVVPRVLPVRGVPAGVRRGHIGADERVEHGGTDLVGLREYVPGDDLRRLHWATSARAGALMVREDADPGRPHLAVILDDRPGGHSEPQGFEDAVELAASLLSAGMVAGHPVRLMATSGAADLEVPAGVIEAGGADADMVMAVLADLQPVDESANAPSQLPARDLDVVAVVCGANADLAPLLLDAGRASVGVVLVVDPNVQDMSAMGSALVLRAPRVEELIQAWDTVVAR
ncbi:uncharacterized protein (DUF58 family) [Kibdelosporangium banguiense]|uniref:Uncharacterized protein (DUF58 family) n=1 Tax=Kibdelosporangium banguiense TaxID=1365924 RepID=A0ABS4U1K0_9PSEU|nr:DUF58 domain-containing protein [Kibdelosporangium banguiense]MBP2330525.1 uncharacterized protein (DUF58 family) [Kibdelosporangium banguiense]